jgi:uncharacterized membrane protein YdjX (TVP38/TMEM64 family)
VNEDVGNPTPRKKPDGRRGLKRDLARIICVTLFFAAMAWLLKQEYVREEVFNIAHIRARFRSHGLKSELAFIGCAAVVNTLGVPRIWICVAAGTLFGAVYGTVAGFAASLLGATANFFIGRYVMRGPLKRRMPERLRNWHKLLNKRGFRVLLYMRLFPFSNATLTSLIGGASRMRYLDFLAATILGFIPQTIAFATLGSSAAKQNRLQLGLGIALFAIVIIAQWVYSRTKSARAAIGSVGDAAGTSAADPQSREGI